MFLVGERKADRVSKGAGWRLGVLHHRLHFTSALLRAVSQNVATLSMRCCLQYFIISLSGSQYKHLMRSSAQKMNSTMDKQSQVKTKKQSFLYNLAARKSRGPHHNRRLWDRGLTPVLKVLASTLDIPTSESLAVPKFRESNTFLDLRSPSRKQKSAICCMKFKIPYQPNNSYYSQIIEYPTSQSSLTPDL
jgi:hypothetical protein